MALNSIPFGLIGDAEDNKANEIWTKCWFNCVNDNCRHKCVDDFNAYRRKKYHGMEDLKWSPVAPLPAHEHFNQEIVQQKYLKNVENSINNIISICGSSIIVILIIIIILLFYFHK